MSTLTFRAGATVTHPHFPLQGHPEQAVVLELHENGSAELDNGLFLPTGQLTLVETGEEWVDVAGYDGKYQVSSLGKVLATNYRRTGRARLLKVQRPDVYPVVFLTDGPTQHQVGINRLVAEHFLASPADESYTHVRPLDGNHLNLAASNLRWSLPEEDGGLKSGEAHRLSTLTDEQVRELRAAATGGITHQELATRYGVARPTVTRLLNGVTRATA